MFKLIDSGRYFNRKQTKFTFERMFASKTREQLQKKGINRIYHQRTRIDFYLTKEVTKQQIIEYTVIKNRENYFTSDHFPYS